MALLVFTLKLILQQITTLRWWQSSKDVDDLGYLRDFSSCSHHSHCGVYRGEEEAEEKDPEVVPEVK